MLGNLVHYQPGSPRDGDSSLRLLTRVEQTSTSDLTCDSTQKTSDLTRTQASKLVKSCNYCFLNLGLTMYFYWGWATIVE